MSDYNQQNKRFAIALSFPGEKRDRVERIAIILSQEFQSRIFYDNWYKAELARPNLDLYLQDIYRNQSELVVVFICGLYDEKMWCHGVEWPVIRGWKNEGAEKEICYLKCDEGYPKGFNPSVDGYIDIENLTDEEVAELLINRYKSNYDQLSYGGLIKARQNYSTLKKKLDDHLISSREYHPSFRLMKINDDLFPNGKLELHSLEVKNDSDEIMPIKQLIKDSWSRKKKNHLMIVGKGGIGKTVTLLSISNKFAPHNVPAIYVPLNKLEENHTERGPLGDYIFNQVLKGRDRENLYYQLLEMANSEWETGPSLLLLLDGFNEIPIDLRTNLGEDIDRWAEYKGLQVIASSRFDIHSYVSLHDEYCKLELLPLSRVVIDEFLNNTGIAIPEDGPLWDVISIPLMLTLYVSTNRVRDVCANDLTYFKQSNNSGSIIWNYLQREIWRLKKGGRNVLNCVVAIEFIAPYIAYKMQKATKYSLVKNEFLGYINEARAKLFDINNEESLPPHIQDVLLECGYSWRIYKQSMPTAETLFNDLQKDLMIFIRRERSFTLMHQQFRDAFAAIHLINASYITKQSLPEEWTDSINDYVMQFIAEIITNEEADRLWDVNRQKVQQSIYATINQLELQKRIKEYDFSGLDFSGLDLRDISLFPYKQPNSIGISLPINAEKFYLTKLSYFTFLPSGHSGPIESIAITPDGKRCISGSDDKTIRIWDIKTGLCLRILRGHTNDVNAVAVTPDGKLCISGSSDRSIRIWDTSTGLVLKRYKGHTNDVNAIVVTPDGRKIISGSDDNSIKIKDINTGNIIKLDGHTDKVNTIAVMPCGRKCISGSCDNTIRIWDINTGQCHKIFKEHSDSVTVIAVTPDGEKLISGSNDKTIRIWSINSGLCLKIIDMQTGWVNDIDVTSDGRRFISGSSDGAIRIWDIDTGLCLNSLRGHNDDVTAIAITPDGEKCISGSNDKTIRIWDMKTGQCLKILEGCADDVSAITFTPDGRKIINGSNDKTIRIWDANTSEWLNTLEGHSDNVKAIAVTPDGRKCLSGSNDKTIKIWDINTGICLNTLLEHSRNVNAIAVTPDGKECISGFDDGIIWILDINSGRHIRTLNGHYRCIESIAITPDGKKCISGSRDNTIIIWELSTGLRLKKLYKHTDRVNAIAITPDGGKFISCSNDKLIRIWDINSGQCLKALKGHSKRVNDIAITPDGKNCISCSDDRTIRIWDILTGRCLKILLCRTDDVNVLATSPDGLMFTSASNKGTIKIMDIDSTQATEISILYPSVSGLDFSQSIIENSNLKETLRQNGARVPLSIK